MIICSHTRTSDATAQEAAEEGDHKTPFALYCAVTGKKEFDCGGCVGHWVRIHREAKKKKAALKEAGMQRG